MVIVFLPGVNAGIWQGIFPKVRGKKASFFLKKRGNRGFESGGIQNRGFENPGCEN